MQKSSWRQFLGVSLGVIMALQGSLAQEAEHRPYFHQHVATRWPWNQDQLQAFLRPFAKNHTVFVIPVNDEYVDLGRNALCSLNAIDGADKHKHVVFWALDSDVVEALHKLREDLRAEFGIIHTPKLYAGKHMKLGTKDYYRTMRERGRFWVQVLQSGFNILFADADIVYFQHPLQEVAGNNGYGSKHHEVTAPELDLVVSTDNRKFVGRGSQSTTRTPFAFPTLCAGLFWVRASPQSVQLFQQLRDRLIAFKKLNDQQALNQVVQQARWCLVGDSPYTHCANGQENTLKVRILDQVEYVNGWLFQHHRQQHTEYLQQGGQQHAVHANWWDEAKQPYLEKAGLWFVDKFGTCKPHD